MQDYEYHFKRNNTHYATVSDLIVDTATRQKIDELLASRWQYVRSAKLLKEQKHK